MLIDPYDLEKETQRILEVAERHAELFRGRSTKPESHCVCFECSTLRTIIDNMERKRERRSNAAAR